MLLPQSLASSLEQNWLVADGGTFPGSVTESADKFSSCVASWFSSAMAATFPCSTAQARRSQLMGQATSALAAGMPPAAGQLLALAVASYYAGQSFGSGVATFPTALSAGLAMFTQVFTDLNMSLQDRASQVAQGCHVMAISTIVVFPPPVPPPAPIF